MQPSKDNVTLSLVSHTNVGKTTLARTLLRRDVGVIADAPHVTARNDRHTMMETSDGAELILWDTPGFGDSAQLLRLLKDVPRPTGWMLEQTFDELAQKPLWCGQQAIRNITESADVVLYLVNASEAPEDAGYIDPEMQILEWLSKPVVVLLNQTGLRRSPNLERDEETRWNEHLQRFPVVKFVMGLDAFARCWVQEDQLLDVIAGVLPFGKRKLLERLREEWRKENREVFTSAMDVLATQLAEAATDREEIPTSSFFNKIRERALKPFGHSPGPDLQSAAMDKLAIRLRESSRAALEKIVRLHKLDAGSIDKIETRLAADFSLDQPVDEGVSAIIGGVVSGAVGGVGIDLLTHGLSFGSGAIIGGVLGAFGAKAVARGYNLVRGGRISYFRWSLKVYSGLVEYAILRYLAVAHYGRGRGPFVESDLPSHWKQEVDQELATNAEELRAIWELARKPEAHSRVSKRTGRLLKAIIERLLKKLYPQCSFD